MRAVPMLLAVAAAAYAAIEWRSLPDLPQALGGQYVGAIGDALAVAGGSYWDEPGWEQGAKRWVDNIYVLAPDAASWREAGKLPQAAAYGATVEIAGGLILLGGQTASGFTASVLHVSLEKGRAAVRRLTDLPEPRAMMNAVVLDNIVYVAGGQASGAPGRALNDFLAIPLDALFTRQSAWTKLPSWDGPPRFFAHAAACAGAIYLAGGTNLSGGAVPQREFLRDAHRYTRSRGWERLPPLPHAAQAGASACHAGRFYIFGGNDGTSSEELREKHPGFRRDVLEYDPSARAWRTVGEVPASLVTTGVARRRGEYVIAGGEDRPGHRSSKVVAARIEGNK